MDNTITIAGNLTREPELRFTTGGRATCSFSVAVSRRYQVNNEWKEETSFLNVVAWAQLAENVAASLTKGARVIVSGRMEQRSYEDKDNVKKYIYEVVADDVGPSLKWATAEIAKTNRASGGGPVAPDGVTDPNTGEERPF